MKITGQNLIGYEFSSEGTSTLQAMNPATGEFLPEYFYAATDSEIDQAVQKAEMAFQKYRHFTGAQKAEFLNQIGDEILELGDTLIHTCMLETGLPESRLQGERGRTINQLNLFADLILEGSWVDARIDTSIPDRKPIPKPDIRQMQIAIGPVGVFGAGNFPLALSVAGGDTASALAAGCPVVVKAHPAHPGTSELVGKAILKAAKTCGIPDGIFSLVQGASHETGQAIVRHPLIKAIGFTGSFQGGKALFDAAARRNEPIPVFAEMGSINPVFILPDALQQKKDHIAESLVSSVTLGTGQFCTNPGLIVLIRSVDSERFIELAGKYFADTEAGIMLSHDIQKGYQTGIDKFQTMRGVEVVAQGNVRHGNGSNGTPYMFKTSAEIFLNNSELSREVFGPSTLSVVAQNRMELFTLARCLEGHLTATLHGTEKDLMEYADLVAILERKVGRLIFNGYPTGVEVCDSMVHGGPFPATTDARTTSVGTTAIRRFSRPVCYQDFPQTALPEELKDHNPSDIWRMINGTFSKESI